MALRRKISRNPQNGTARLNHFGRSGLLLGGLTSSPTVRFEEVV